jgi:hypothetical protein
VLPELADALDAAAGGFDEVRYLRRPGTPALYAQIADADDRAQAASVRAPSLETAR